LSKIIECFSTKLVTRITLYINKIVDEIDENGMVVKQTMFDEQQNVNVTLRKYKNTNDILKVMSDAKLKYIDSDGYLFMVTDENNRLGVKLIPEPEKQNILSKIKVEDNFVYGQKEASYNEEIFEKIVMVHNKVKEYEPGGDLLPIDNAINAIKRSYKNTGVISKDDLKWLNKVYNKLLRRDKYGN